MIADELTIGDKTRLVKLVMKEIADLEEQKSGNKDFEKDIRELELIIEKLERM